MPEPIQFELEQVLIDDLITAIGDFEFDLSEFMALKGLNPEDEALRQQLIESEADMVAMHLWLLERGGSHE